VSGCLSISISNSNNGNNNYYYEKSELVFVRVNGELPDITSVLDSNSARAEEVRGMASLTNTSCSIISHNSNRTNFHLLVDSGLGVVRSLENIPKSGILGLHSVSYLPDALLLTHSHDDHVHDIDSLLNHYDSNRQLKIFCTGETHEQVRNKFDHHRADSKVKFIDIKPSESIEIGPFTVTPFSANHHSTSGDNKNSKKDESDSILPGCVIFVVQLQNKKKIVIGWDFQSINSPDQALLWNPDLVILGTETYNPHPSTGMISVTEAYDFVRTWNAKECFIVHYDGSMDSEDAKNQWFRGPTRAMTSTQLQDTINEQLKISGNDGKFKITVAKAGQVWSTDSNRSEETSIEDQKPVGKIIEIEGLQNYILRLECGKGDPDQNKLYLTLEDRINRYALEFVNPHLDKNNLNILLGDPVKGMMTKGPELQMQINLAASSEFPESSQISMNIARGKKQIFKDNIFVKSADGAKLKRFTRENFG
jgi:phosphoribosyl 1,2-cyclic phosphodiesterase